LNPVFEIRLCNFFLFLPFTTLNPHKTDLNLKNWIILFEIVPLNSRHCLFCQFSFLAQNFTYTSCQSSNLIANRVISLHLTQIHRAARLNLCYSQSGHLVQNTTTVIANNRRRSHTARRAPRNRNLACLSPASHARPTALAHEERLLAWGVKIVWDF